MRSTPEHVFCCTDEWVPLLTAEASRDKVGGWGYETNIISHFGPDLSSPGLTLVPTGIIKPRNLLKKLSKHERRQTNGYRMRFIVNFNQRIAM